MTEAFKIFFQGVIKDLVSQNPKVPVDKFRVEVDQHGGRLFAPDWFKYMITGRGPGGMPPVEKIADWAEKNIKSDLVRENKDGTFSLMTINSLAYAIATKIAKEGTDVFQGKRKGVDLLSAMEKNTPDLLAELVKNELIQITTSLKSALR